MNDRRLRIIKILLNYVIEKTRQEENFMDLINENKDLFNMDISPAVFPPVYEIADELKIKDEEQIEQILDFFNRKDLDNETIVEEFCRKYNI